MDKVYVVMYGIGWPEDGDEAAGVYSTPELAVAAAAKNSVAWVREFEIDAEPDYSRQRD